MMIKLILAGILASLSLSAFANFAKTPQEEAMCQAMIYNGRDTSDIENWRHMHHFCDCIRFTNRAYSQMGNWSGMKYNLQIAIGGCQYVLDKTKPYFYMRPEVHLQKGKALRLFKQEGKAVTELMEAIKGNPRLAQAYAELADIQAGNKKNLDALKTVTEGLRYVPDSKPLMRRYTELGGKLPFPERIVPQQTETQDLQPAEEITAPVHAPATPKAESQAPATSTPETTNSQIGTPTNPYCRFCPD